MRTLFKAEGLSHGKYINQLLPSMGEKKKKIKKEKVV